MDGMSFQRNKHTSTIAGNAVSKDLLLFEQDPQSDATCGLSGMLSWTNLDFETFMATMIPLSNPVWSTNRVFTADPASLKKAIFAIKKVIPSQHILANTHGSAMALNQILMDTVLFFSKAMIQSQLGAFQDALALEDENALLVVYNAAEMAGLRMIPTGTLAQSLAAASKAVSHHLAGLPLSQSGLTNVESLETLIPMMFTPYWTLSYYASYGDGRKHEINPMNKSYSMFAVSNTFNNWLEFINQQSDQAGLGPIIDWLAAARETVVNKNGSTKMMAQQYATASKAASDSGSGLQSLQTTNAQFERRRASVNAMAENLSSTRLRTWGARLNVAVWLTALILAVGIAIILFRANNHGMLRILIVVTLALLTLDTLARGVASVNPYPGMGRG